MHGVPNMILGWMQVMLCHRNLMGVRVKGLVSRGCLVQSRGDPVKLVNKKKIPK